MWKFIFLNFMGFYFERLLIFFSWENRKILDFEWNFFVGKFLGSFWISGSSLTSVLFFEVLGCFGESGKNSEIRIRKIW